ncbi:MAG: DUF1353 domain-containing protein [Planctomycetota bacterium]
MKAPSSGEQTCVLSGDGPVGWCGGPLQTERLRNGRRKLLRTFCVAVDGRQILVPAETDTDFSSIPSYARFLVRWSKVDLAGVVHDYLYQVGLFPRSYADRIWRLVAVSGKHRANPVQAWIAWFFLRVFGHIAWMQHRRRQKLNRKQQKDGCSDP